MHNHLLQSEHNEQFHLKLQEFFPSSFFDWKITVLFYCAIHYLKALAVASKADIGDTHFDIERSVNPDRTTATMRISRTAWINYKRLYHYSRNARYNGIIDLENFEELKKRDYQMCILHFNDFKKYITSRGIPLT